MLQQAFADPAVEIAGPIDRMLRSVLRRRLLELEAAARVRRGGRRASRNCAARVVFAVPALPDIRMLLARK